MTTHAKPGAITGTGSHHVTVDHYGRTDKEEVYVTIEATWRGAPAVVTMSCDRYRGSGADLGTWRVYASDAREPGTDGALYGHHLTDTARARLSEACRPLAVDWLTTDAYRASLGRAYERAAFRALDKARHYSATPTSEARAVLAANVELISADRAAHISAVCDAFDQYAMIRNATEETA